MTLLAGRTTTPGVEELDPAFIERRSTRAFSSEPLTEAELLTLFEAARWAPSAGNTQPWLFLYTTDGPEREVFNSFLRPGNKTWATAAPVLAILIAAKRNEEGRAFRTSQFDAGAAWMSLALQATKMGMFAHAIGGIEIDAVHEQLEIPRDDFDVMVGIAIGRGGDTSTLPDDLQAKERPNSRKSLSEVAKRWSPGVIASVG